MNFRLTSELKLPPDRLSVRPHLLVRSSPRPAMSSRLSSTLPELSQPARQSSPAGLRPVPAWNYCATVTCMIER